MRSSALVAKLKTFCGTIEPLVTGFSADSILPAQSADCVFSCCDLRNELFSLFHNSPCLPRHLTHFLCLSDVFILAKNCYLCLFSTCYLCYYSIHICVPYKPAVNTTSSRNMATNKNHHPVGAVIDRPCSHPGICDTTGKRRGRAMLAPTTKGTIAIKIIAPYKNVSARRTHQISTLNSQLLTLR